MMFEARMSSSASRAGLREDPIITEIKISLTLGYYDIDFGINDKGFYTPDSTTGGAAAD